MKKITYTFIISIFALIATAQPGALKWLPDGNAYTSLDKYSVVKTELPSLTKTVLFELEKFIPKDETHPREISSFALSADLKQVLLKINTQTQYHKTTGEVWVYNSKDEKIIQLGKTLRAEGLMYPKFSPDGTKVA
jgi:dipeptidyl-peptidase-4